MAEEYLPAHARKDNNSMHNSFVKSIHADPSKIDGIAKFIEEQEKSNPYFDSKNPFAPSPGQAEEYLSKEH